MARPFSLIVVLFTAGLMAISPTLTLSAGYTGLRAAETLVPARGAYLGAYIQLDPVVNNDIAAFERLVGKQHLSYLRYVGYGEPFPFRWVQEVLRHGAMPQIAWEPNNGLAEVQDDAYLRGWAQAAAHAGGPILLRYASEMNGDWMPYSGDPDEYIRKWRMVYRVFRDTAPNVVFIWCPFALPRSTIPLYYPGDEYVDWVGVNVYAVVHNDGDVRRPATETQLDQLRFVYNLYADRKPIAICEYAATHYCAAVSQQVTDFAVRSMREFYTALQTKFPRVMFISWFSVQAATDGLANNDYAVTNDPQVLATYRELISDSYFLTRFPEFTAAPEPGPLPPVILPDTGPTLTPVLPQHPLPLEGPAVPGPRELAISLRGAPARALTGTVTLTAVLGKDLPVQTVTIYLDGRIRLLTNAQPFTWTWDTSTATPGEHVLRVEVLAPNGEEVAVREVSLIVAPRETGPAE